MRVRLNEKLETVAELDWLGLVRLMFGRVITVPGSFPVHIREQHAYEAFNLAARPERR